MGPKPFAQPECYRRSDEGQKAWQDGHWHWALSYANAVQQQRWQRHGLPCDELRHRHTFHANVPFVRRMLLPYLRREHGLRPGMRIGLRYIALPVRLLHWQRVVPGD